MEEGRIEFRGDFLVRNIVGVDPNTGALAVAAKVRQWQVLQFLLRDAKTAEQDLSARLERYPRTAAGRRAALLVHRARQEPVRARPITTPICSARASAPCRSAASSATARSDPSAAQTFLHGYTSAFGLFRHK